MVPADPQPSPLDGEGLKRPPGESAVQGGPLGWKRALALLVTFEISVLVFATVALAVELALGYSPYQGHFSGPSRAVSDAIWHLATALVLVVPARNRVLLVVGPTMALGLDIDHVFGAFLPVVTPRPAHDLFFVGLLALALYLLFGRLGALLGPGAVLAHFAVDGGTFPFFAPVTVHEYPLGFPEQVILLLVGALLIFLSSRKAAELRRPRTLATFVGAVGIVALALLLLWPWVHPFTSQ